MGTGTALVTKYYNTAFVLDNEKEYLLVDGMGGTEVLKCFETMELDWRKMHYALLSHEHTDHFLGMIWVIRYVAFLMCEGKYEGTFHVLGHEEVLEKARMVCQALLRRQEREMIGSRILLEAVEHLQEKQICGSSFRFFDIASTKAKQFGFQMRWPDGRKLVFPGDEPLSENTMELCRDADWLLSEAYCLYEEREIHTPYRYHHSTVREASETAERFHVKNLVLWHTEDATYGERKRRYTEEAGRYYRGNVWVPDDGEVILL